MTPKEKEKELIDKCATETAEFSQIGGGYGDVELGKPCALICVNEILKAGSADIVNQYFDDRYWMEVIKEIESL